MLTQKKNSKHLIAFLIILIFTLPILYAQKKQDSIHFYKSKYELYNSKNVDSAYYFIKKLQNISPISEKIYYVLEEGKLDFKNGLLEKSIVKYTEALLASQKIKDKYLEGLSHNYIGYHYFLTNNPVYSYEHYLKANNIFKSIENWDMYYVNLSNLGEYIELKGDYLKAINIYKESIQYFKKKNDIERLISTSINYGNVINVLEGFEKGLKVYDELLKYPIKNQNDLSLIYYNMALNYYELSDFEKAIESINKAILITEKIDDENRLMDVYGWKAEILSSLKDYKNATIFNLKALKYAKKYNDITFQKSIYESLIGIQLKTKKYDSIQYWFKQINLLTDSSQISQNALLKQQLNVEEKLNEKEIEKEKNLNSLLKEKHQKDLIFFIIVLGSLVSILFSIIFYFNKKNIQKNLSLSNLKASQIEKQVAISDLENRLVKEELKAQKREMLSTLLFIKEVDKEVKNVLNNIEHLMNNSIISKDDLVKLKNDIIQRSNRQMQNSEYEDKLTKTHKKFFIELLNLFPNLTTNELKILAYFRVGLNSKEIASIQNVTIEAIRKSRYRIRKKLNLESDESLEIFLLKFH